ncbi:Arc family DNA-binding protein [Guyparkeria sp. SB14A]|uniref:Arc family DNA-binding protein n=1 Tax=Guyparkeria sp. SB14A TaxID=2571147 RepID=UPI0010AB8B2E|nr:Arc family DNA-binding protein [Guyparkeria sp. SB14A]TKA91809.1 Arc family DNA-binding protein [Guyparkeria sp. SB14A]
MPGQPYAYPFRMSDELRERVVAKANQEDRSINYMLNKLVEQALNQEASKEEKHHGEHA